MLKSTLEVNLIMQLCCIRRFCCLTKKRTSQILDQTPTRIWFFCYNHKFYYAIPVFLIIRFSHWGFCAVYNLGAVHKYVSDQRGAEGLANADIGGRRGEGGSGIYWHRLTKGGGVGLAKAGITDKYALKWANYRFLLNSSSHIDIFDQILCFL